MSNEKNGAGIKLDLGLAALLANQDGESATNNAGEAVEPARPTAILTLDDDGVDFNRELLSLAQQRQWGVLVSKAEAAIGTDEDLEARLWWIRGHLGGFSLPVSLLAAPFETVCRQLKGDSRLDVYRQLVKEIGEMVVNRLRDVGDRRQEQSVRSALSELGVIDQGGNFEPVWSKVPPLVPRFELGEPRQGDPVQQSGVERQQEVVSSGRRSFPRLVLFASLFVVAALAGGFISWRAVLREPEVALASEDLMQVSEGIGALRLPVVSSRPVSGKLGVFYSLTEQQQRQQQQQQNATLPSGAPAPRETQRGGGSFGAAVARPEVVNSGGIGDRPPAPERSSDAAGGRDEVRTDGPIEGIEFKRGVERRGAVGEPSNAARLPDPLPKPSASDDSKSASYPDGSLVLAGEVKSVVVPTDVFDKAGFQGIVIAHLDRGDQVHIEGRVGPWLRIRSRKGRVGFVFAQDIGEIEEFNIQTPASDPQ